MRCSTSSIAALISRRLALAWRAALADPAGLLAPQGAGARLVALQGVLDQAHGRIGDQRRRLHLLRRVLWQRVQTILLAQPLEQFCFILLLPQPLLGRFFLKLAEVVDLSDSCLSNPNDSLHTWHRVYAVKTRRVLQSPAAQARFGRSRNGDSRCPPQCAGKCIGPDCSDG